MTSKKQEGPRVIMQNEVINVIAITPEAVLDYKEGLNLGILNQRRIKADVAEYINILNRDGRLNSKHYFRCKFLDEKNDEMLMLFLYRGNRLSIMQYWLLAGVCRATDWDEDSEDKGLIRLWLKTKIEDMPNGMDEVIALRVREIIENTSKTKWENVLKEVINAFDCERDKGFAEKLAFLQRLHFD